MALWSVWSLRWTLSRSLADRARAAARDDAFGEPAAEARGAPRAVVGAVTEHRWVHQ